MQTDIVIAGESTAKGISDEVCFAIMEQMFEEHVTGLLPKTNKEMEVLQTYDFSIWFCCH